MSEDLTLAAICSEQNSLRYRYTGFYLLLHHTDQQVMKNIKVYLPNARFHQNFEFLERFKTKTSESDEDYDYYVALKIRDSVQMSIYNVINLVEVHIEDLRSLMLSCRPPINVSSSSSSRFNFQDQVS